MESPKAGLEARTRSLTGYLSHLRRIPGIIYIEIQSVQLLPLTIGLNYKSYTLPAS